MTVTNVGSPKGREPYGDGVPVVVAGVTPPKWRPGKPSTGRRGPGDRITGDCEGMRNAERRNGAWCPPRTWQERPAVQRTYRQMFNKELYLLAYGRIYSNHGAMTPGADGETADGMSRGRSTASSSDAPRALPVQPGTPGPHSRKRTGNSARWACHHGRTNWSARWSACCLRRTTSRSSPLAHTDSGTGGAAIPHCGRWQKPGPGPRGLSREISPTASGLIMRSWSDTGGENPR